MGLASREGAGGAFCKFSDSISAWKGAGFVPQTRCAGRAPSRFAATRQRGSVWGTQASPSGAGRVLRHVDF